MRILERRRSRPIDAAIWRRFQVSQAHELRRRMRAVPPIMAGIFLVSGITLLLRYPESGMALLGVYALAALGYFGLGVLARIASPRGVVGLAMLMPTFAGLTSAATMVVEPATFATTMTSLSIIPIGAPLLLGWDATTNRRWTLAYGLGVGGLALTVGSLSMDQRLDVVILVAILCSVGVLVANLLQDLRLQTIEKELQLRRLNRELHGYATTDPLTRLRNRRQLAGDVAIMWPSIRRGATSTVVMFDLDHFKHLNDERGHAAGDSALRLVAVELQRQVRGRDSVSRVGGEEFLVLLRDTDLEGGLQVADRIRTAIADLGVPSSGGANPARLTISGGVAMADAQADSWDTVVATADAALYAAKEAGRNLVYGPAGVVTQAA